MVQTYKIPGLDLAERYAKGEISVEEYWKELEKIVEEQTKNSELGKLCTELEELAENLGKLADGCKNCPNMCNPPVQCKPEHICTECEHHILYPGNWMMRGKRLCLASKMFDVTCGATWHEECKNINKTGCCSKYEPKKKK